MPISRNYLSKDGVCVCVCVEGISFWMFKNVQRVSMNRSYSIRIIVYERDRYVWNFIWNVLEKKTPKWTTVKKFTITFHLYIGSYHRRTRTVRRMRKERPTVVLFLCEFTHANGVSSGNISLPPPEMLSQRGERSRRGSSSKSKILFFITIARCVSSLVQTVSYCFRGDLEEVVSFAIARRVSSLVQTASYCFRGDLEVVVGFARMYRPPLWFWYIFIVIIDHICTRIVSAW